MVNVSNAKSELLPHQEIFAEFVTHFGLEGMLLPARFDPLTDYIGIAFDTLRFSEANTVKSSENFAVLQCLTSQMRLVNDTHEAKAPSDAPSIQMPVWKPDRNAPFILFTMDECENAKNASFDVHELVEEAHAFQLLYNQFPKNVATFDSKDALLLELMKRLDARKPVCGATENMVATRRFMTAIDADPERMFRPFRKFVTHLETDPKLQQQLVSVHNIGAFHANVMNETEFEARVRAFTSSPHHALSAYTPGYDALRGQVEHADRIASRIGQDVARALAITNPNEVELNVMHAWLFNAICGQSFLEDGFWKSGLFRHRPIMKLDARDLCIENALRHAANVLHYAPRVQNTAVPDVLQSSLRQNRNLIDFVSMAGLVLRSPPHPLVCTQATTDCKPVLRPNVSDLFFTYS